MKITFEHGVDEYRRFVHEFELVLRGHYKHGNFAHDETINAIADLWDAWHELKADLPRGEE